MKKRTKINIDSLSSITVLVAPLDWGLGHASRCIPIIRALLSARCKVLLAGDGKVRVLLQQEFPELRFLYLEGYQIQYASTPWGLPFKIVAQIPKLLLIIKKEKEWLQKVIAEEEPDVVISDNRYGLHHPKIKSVFITHQLRIKAPFKGVEDLLQWITYRYINQFDECWVPDAAGEMNLAAQLSHPVKLPAAALKYIGSLSRFSLTGQYEKKHLLIILSGPEPQRSLLEKIVARELETYTEPVVLVRGLPESELLPGLASNIVAYNHLPSIDLEVKMREATFVISRCGYSTIMDLAELKMKSILIPTPGQTEQQYLAKHLMKINFALCIEQKKFRLKHALEMAQAFPYNLPATQQNSVEPVIESLIKELHKKKESHS